MIDFSSRQISKVKRKNKNERKAKIEKQNKTKRVPLQKVMPIWIGRSARTDLITLAKVWENASWIDFEDDDDDDNDDEDDSQIEKLLRFIWNIPKDREWAKKHNTSRFATENRVQPKLTNNAAAAASH